MQLIQHTIHKLKSTDSLLKKALLNKSIDYMIKNHPVCFAKVAFSNSRTDARKFINAVIYAKIVSSETVMLDMKSCHSDCFNMYNNKFID